MTDQREAVAADGQARSQDLTDNALASGETGPQSASLHNPPPQASVDPLRTSVSSLRDPAGRGPSQNARILDYLQAGNVLTPLKALVMFDSLRLGARIYDLKRAGHKIETRTIWQGRKHWAEYYISP